MKLNLEPNDVAAVANAVRDSIATKQAARPTVDNQGRPLPDEEQNPAYRALLASNREGK